MRDWRGVCAASCVAITACVTAGCTRHGQTHCLGCTAPSELAASIREENERQRPKSPVELEQEREAARATERDEVQARERKRMGASSPGSAQQLAARGITAAARGDCETARTLEAAIDDADTEVHDKYMLEPAVKRCYDQPPVLQQRREQAWSVTKDAEAAARAGDCAKVVALDAKVRVLDAEFHDTVFARDAAIARCLVERPR
jgi:hypothetical protein